jgi:hypothetical protein
VDARPEAAYRAIRDLDPRQVAQAVPAMQLMGWFRALPVRITARYRQDSQTAPETLPADQAEEAFVPVAETPGTEFVVAMIGKFSSPTELEFRRFDPADCHNRPAHGPAVPALWADHPSLRRLHHAPLAGPRQAARRAGR